MALTPLSNIGPELGSMNAQAYADRHADEDVVVVEPYEKEWDYQSAAFHSGASYQFINKAEGKEVVVGRADEATVHIDHPMVSRRQCALTYAEESWQVTGMAGQDGTWMEGEDLRDAMEEAWGTGDPRLHDGKYYRVEDFFGPSPVPYDAPLRLNHGVVIRILQPASFATKLCTESSS